MRFRARAHREIHPGAEAAGAASEQHRDGVGAVVGGDEVELAVAIHIHRLDRRRSRAHGVVDLRAEAAEALAIRIETLFAPLFDVTTSQIPSPFKSTAVDPGRSASSRQVETGTEREGTDRAAPSTSAEHGESERTGIERHVSV